MQTAPPFQKRSSDLSASVPMYVIKLKLMNFWKDRVYSIQQNLTPNYDKERMLLWICLIEQALGTGGGQKQGFEPPTIIASHRGGTAFVKDAETLFEMPSFAKQRSGPPGNYCKCFKSKNAFLYNRLPNFDQTPNTT